VPQILYEEERLANPIMDSILPLITPDIEIQSSRGKELLIIHVSHGIGPYYLKSEGPEHGVYVRFGSTNRSVDADMLDSLRLLAKKISYEGHQRSIRRGRQATDSTSSREFGDRDFQQWKKIP
jgi:predicted HTH transcriptional regulator